MALGCRNFRIVTNSYMFGSDYQSEVTREYLLCEDCGHIEGVSDDWQSNGSDRKQKALAHATELYFAETCKATKEELGRVK